MSDDRLTLNTEEERQVWLAVLCSEASSGAADDAVRAYRRRLPSYQQAESMCDGVDEQPGPRAPERPFGPGAHAHRAWVESQAKYDGTPTGPGWWWGMPPESSRWAPWLVIDGQDGLAVSERGEEYPLEGVWSWGGRCTREGSAEVERLRADREEHRARAEKAEAEIAAVRAAVLDVASDMDNRLEAKIGQLMEWHDRIRAALEEVH